MNGSAATRPSRSTCASIAATNRDLRREVTEGRFREDLYYRLNVVAVEMPSLRERREDVPLLAMHFLQRHALENNKEVAGFSDAALAYMSQHSWPGNVRELENAVERAVVVCRNAYIAAEDLPRALLPATASKGRLSGDPGGDLRRAGEIRHPQDPRACRRLHLTRRRHARYVGAQDPIQAAGLRSHPRDPHQRGPQPATPATATPGFLVSTSTSERRPQADVPPRNRSGT